MLMELSTLYLFLKSDVDAFFGVCEEFLVSVVLGQTIAPLYIETINSSEEDAVKLASPKPKRGGLR